MKMVEISLSCVCYACPSCHSSSFSALVLSLL
jgi:hypothetical protein